MKRSITRKLIAGMLLAFAFVTQAFAQDEHATQLHRMIAISKRAPVNAQIADKLMVFKLSPAAWEHVLDTSGDGSQTVMNLAGTLADVAQQMKMGDVVRLDGNSGYDGKSPLVAEMIDGWRDKIRFTIAVDAPDVETAKKAFANINYVMSPLTNEYYFLPAGGKAFVNIAANAKASDVSCKVSADGNTYDIVVPIHASFSQSRLEELLRAGRAE